MIPATDNDCNEPEADFDCQSLTTKRDPIEVAAYVLDNIDFMIAAARSVGLFSVAATLDEAKCEAKTQLNILRLC